MFDLALLTAEHFSPLIGSALAIEGSDDSLTVESVETFSSSSPRPQAFSVVFTTPESRHGEQGVYHLRHPDLGVLQMLLVPIGRAGQRDRMEAVFN